MPTEKELLAQGDHVTCKCCNVIPLSAFYCPYCKSRNMATTVKECPTCGQSLAKEAPVA